MHALKNALSPTRIVTSVASTLTFGTVTKPVVSELIKMSRAAARFAGFGRAPVTVRTQKSGAKVAPPAQYRISAVRLSGIVMNVDFIKRELGRLAKDLQNTPAYNEIKSLDSTAQYYLTGFEKGNVSEQATQLSHLHTAFCDFRKRAENEGWSAKLDDSFLVKLDTRIDMIQAQRKVLANSI